MILGVINPHETEPLDYTERKTAKAVVLGSDGRILTFPSNLLGGGVEEGESYEEALHREVLEEAGIQVEILKPLGEVIGYRDHKKQKYIVKGYLCKYIDTISAPTTTDANELKIKAVWEKPEESIVRLQEEIKKLEIEGPEKYELDTFQSKLGNRQISLAFLKEFLNQ